MTDTTSTELLRAHSERRRKLETLGNEIAELSAHIQAATRRLLDLVAEFDALGGWHDAFSTCAHWLAWRTA